MSEFESQITAETSELKDSVKSVLNESDRSRKEEIIDRLGDDWLIDLQGHLESARLDYEARHGQNEPFEAGKVLRGAIFESLVAADREIFGKEEQGAERELREVLHQPERFGPELERQFGHIRTPDLALINAEGTITAFAEVKMSWLDDRAYQQLKKSGSLRSLALAAEFLSTNHSHLAEWGLTELAERSPESIAVDAHCRRVLVVPKNRDISDPANLIAFNAEIGRDNYNRPHFEYVLRNELRVVPSPFSVDEVVAIANLVLERV